MKKNLFTMAAVAGLLLFANCGDDNKNNPSGPDTNTGLRPGHDDVVPAGAIEIATFEDLCKIGKAASHTVAATYVLTADIDASASKTMNGGEGFEPIAMSGNPAFTGRFYGKGHTISNLYINRTDNSAYSAYNSGLFGITSGSISGVHLVDVSITGARQTGGIAGSNTGGEISKSSVTGGTVMSTEGYAGGIAGSGLNITECYSAVTVVSSATSNYAGGLVGSMSVNGTISRSYASGSVSGAGAGGLVGDMTGTMVDCYSVARVFSNNSYGTGGLVGRASGSGANNITISRSYAAGPTSSSSWLPAGGLVGSSAYVFFPATLTITYSYWDTEATGVTTPLLPMDEGGEAVRTTNEMKQQSTYEGFDFTSVWAIRSGGYPYLRALGPTVSAR